MSDVTAGSGMDHEGASLRSANQQQEPVLKQESECAPTHDFSRTMRSECCISEAHNGGATLSLYGWTYKPLATGDFLLLAHQDGRVTRYRLTEFRPCADPQDMWFGKAAFAPRTACARCVRTKEYAALAGESR